MNSLKELSDLLFSKDEILILTHASPDGDTLGSGCALALALRGKGKKANITNSDDIPEKYLFMTELVPDMDFSPRFIVSVDVADVRLLGRKNEELYGSRVDLSIDHHGTNRLFAKKSFVEAESASCAEIIFLLLREAGCEITGEIADCLFVGVSTDTGCFRFANVTARTHKIAAELIEAGAEAAKINRAMFETKSPGFLKLEQLCLEGLELFFDGKMSLFVITRKMIDETVRGDEDFDSIIALSRAIQGVCLGVTVKEKKEGGFKVSVRTDESIDAASFCAVFGGGGHRRAAGCSFDLSLDEVKRRVLEEAGKLFPPDLKS